MKPWVARLRRVPDAVWLVAAWLPVAALQVAPWSRRNGLDDIAYVAPNQQVTLDAWRALRAPMWNEFVFGGSPHLGNLQTAALYPLHLLSAPFPDLVGIDVESAVHVLILGLGWWWLGRRLGFTRSAALAMGAIAMWSGATVSRSGALAHLPPLAWAPVVMACVHLTVTSPRQLRSVGLTAVALWCMLCSGHPQSVLMASVLVGAWTIGVVVQERAPRRLLALAGAAGLTVAMALPIVLAARWAVDAQYATVRTLDALRTPGWYLPRRNTAITLFGQPLDAVRVVFAGHESIAYLGAAAGSLAVLGLVVSIRARAVAAWCVAAVGLFALFLSYGPSSPVLRAARRWLPGFDQPRVSARWLWVTVMAGVLLAGYGMDALRRRRERRDVVGLGIAAAAVAVLLVLGLGAGATRTPTLWLFAVGAVAAAWWNTGRRHTIAVGAVAAIAIVELLVPVLRLGADAEGRAATSSSELQGAAARVLSDSPGLALSITNEVYEEHYVVAGMRPNANVLADVRFFDGYDGGVWMSERWVAAVHQFVPEVNDLTFHAQLFDPLDPERMARLGVAAVLYDPDRGPAAVWLPGWLEVPVDDHFEVWENPAWEGDVTVWYRTEVADDPAAAGDRIREEFDELTATGLVEDAGAVLVCSGPCAPEHAVSSSPHAGERRVTVDAAQPAVVAFAEQFDQGWTATVDGVGTDVIAVDGVWAGVMVPAGTHEVVLRYEPQWWWLSVIVALLGWLAAIGLIVTPTLARRFARSSADPSASVPHE